MSSDYPPSAGSEEIGDDSVSMRQVDEASMTSTEATTDAATGPDEDAALAEAAEAAARAEFARVAQVWGTPGTPGAALPLRVRLALEGACWRCHQPWLPSHVCQPAQVAHEPAADEAADEAVADAK